MTGLLSLLKCGAKDEMLVIGKQCANIPCLCCCGAADAPWNCVWFGTFPCFLLGLHFHAGQATGEEGSGPTALFGNQMQLVAVEDSFPLLI